MQDEVVIKSGAEQSAEALCSLISNDAYIHSGTLIPHYACIINNYSSYIYIYITYAYTNIIINTRHTLDYRPAIAIAVTVESKKSMK